MGKESLSNAKGHPDEMGKNGALDKQSNFEFRPGDMAWIKLCGTSWWPAQIVDENAVNDDLKPRKGKRGEVLVRLYGTYEYSFMDPMTSHLEFNNVLKQNKGSQREIFQQALEQALSKLQSRRTKARRATAKGNGSVHEEKTLPSKRATEEQDGYDDTPSGSARRLKVMQDLGLTAPSGSPFHKNGQILSVLE